MSAKRYNAASRRFTWLLLRQQTELLAELQTAPAARNTKPPLWHFCAARPQTHRHEEHDPRSRSAACTTQSSARMTLPCVAMTQELLPHMDDSSTFMFIVFRVKRREPRGRMDETGGGAPRSGGRGRLCGLRGPALMRGAPRLGGLLPLSHSHCGHGCLSLAARYQRAFWEVVPQGPPWSGPRLFLSHHIFGFFFSPLICFIPVPDLFEAQLSR